MVEVMQATSTILHILHHFPAVFPVGASRSRRRAIKYYWGRLNTLLAA